ncbi:uncharacterized protein H6S33_006819 [Morchella sextelata]|uniref:uncharacterized protein n=1 Tax=Morchella sextelata TaxID=1174677 RepID=UPI001D0516DF|nr:uncharacterized protein H6S33_006819 [Morchella sextelata]KAH0604442.1 hypothetical protein H6S33_006819 [Morchella sextelata]
MATPMTSRPKDLFYFLFSAMFTTSMVFMDLIPLWPKAILPQALKDNHTWYLTTFNDQLMIKFEPWFAAFLAVEALYQLPTTIWFLSAIPSENPKFPARALTYASISFLTTLTSCWAIWKDGDMTEMQKYILLGFYAPFAGIFGFMAMDMSCRIQAKMAPKAVKGKKRV